MYSFSLSDVIVPCKGLLSVAIRCFSNMNRRHLRQSRTTRHTTNIMTKPVRDRAENTFCLDVPALFLGRCCVLMKELVSIAFWMKVELGSLSDVAMQMACTAIMYLPEKKYVLEITRVYFAIFDEKFK